MACPRVAASPLLVLGVAWALAALAPGSAPAAHAATVARAQEQALVRGRGAEGAADAWAPSGAGRQRRSPREDMEEQQDETEPVDPEQKPQDKPGLFKRFLQKVKEMAKKAVEFAKRGVQVVREIMDSMGCFDQGKRNGGGAGGGGGGGGGGGDNAETMSPDRLQSESESGK